LSPALVALLGAIAGFTIFLGLPIARLKSVSKRTREVLNATATGVLVFLLWDVLSAAVEPIEGSMNDAVHGDGGWGTFALNAIVGLLGLTVGLVSLAYYERWIGGRAAAAAATSKKFGPGAMAVDEPVTTTRGLDLANPARRLAMLIAIGIGLHNFAEGLAIGQSAVTPGGVRLAVMLIIGFALHNATEGFGITAPLASLGQRPTWGFLALLGLIGGGPTFVGTLIGQSFANDVVAIGFLTLAAGSILYVIVQLVGVAAKLGRTHLFYWGLLGGLVMGFATDLIIAANGA
jgi:ZIP family zinc transporter